jgi:hypothetical protein
MTHPITPPPELVQQWADMLASHSDEAVFTRVAQWGADQELEACCALMDDWGLEESDLRAARRLKPPSLKEQALTELERVDTLWDTTEFGHETINSLDTIRRALETLPE